MVTSLRVSLPMSGASPSGHPRSLGSRWVLAAGCILLASGCGGDEFTSAPDAVQERDGGAERSGHAGPADAATVPDASEKSLDAMLLRDGEPSESQASGANAADAAADRGVQPVPDGSPPDGASQDGGVFDASQREGGLEGGCVAVEWFPDDDEDGFGRSSGAVTACAKPEGSWSLLDGDCNDDNPDVHPGQETYFGAPYTTGGGDESFDFDCDGVETGDPDQPGPAANCGLLGLPCNHTGYVSTGRSGPGISGICGSTTLRICGGAALCSATVQHDAAPKRCR